MSRVVLTTVLARTQVEFDEGTAACRTTGQRSRAAALGVTHTVRIARGPAWLARAASEAGYSVHVLGYTNNRRHGGCESETFGLVPVAAPVQVAS